MVAPVPFPCENASLLSPGFPMRMIRPLVSGASALSAPLSRREVLRVGALGLMGISLPRLLQAEDSAKKTGTRPRADACVVIFLNGGPSHLDMWDMKPEAPVEIRGEFRPIETTAPGIQLCEH